MTTEVFLPISQLPGLPKLTADYLLDSKRTKHFFAGDFRLRADFQKIAQKIRNTTYPRKLGRF